MGYDAADQVTAFGAETFSYDASGNRDMAGYVVGAGNRVSTDGTWTFTYDAEGQRTKRSQGVAAETWEYGYDARGQMAWAEKRATDAGTLLERYQFGYDAYGNRVETTLFDGVTTVTYRTAFAPDNEAWADVDGGNTLIDRYLRVRGEELPVGHINGTNLVAWLHADRLGSLRVVTDEAGTLKSLLSYTAFGKVASETDAAWGGRFKWTGQEAEPGLGMQRHGWRWYDLETGTWSTEDPIGFTAGDYNLTRYVGNNAANLVDPTGLELSVAPGRGEGVLHWARINRLKVDHDIFPDGAYLIDLRGNSDADWVRAKKNTRKDDWWIVDRYRQASESDTHHWHMKADGSWIDYGGKPYPLEIDNNFIWWFRNERPHGVSFSNAAVKFQRTFTPSAKFDQGLFWRNVDKLAPGLRDWFQKNQSGHFVRRDYSFLTFHDTTMGLIISMKASEACFTSLTVTTSWRRRGTSLRRSRRQVGVLRGRKRQRRGSTILLSMAIF